MHDINKKFLNANKKQLSERNPKVKYKIPYLFNEFLRSSDFAPPTIGKSNNSLVLQTWDNYQLMNKIDIAMTQKEAAIQEKANLHWNILKKRQKIVGLLRNTKQGGLLKKMRKITGKSKKKFSMLKQL